MKVNSRIENSQIWASNVQITDKNAKADSENKESQNVLEDVEDKVQVFDISEFQQIQPKQPQGPLSKPNFDKESPTNTPKPSSKILEVEQQMPPKQE